MVKNEGIWLRFTLIAVTALLWIIMGAKPVQADAATTVASGTCGDNLTWVLDEDGLLTISGTGAMTDWENSTGSDVPWYDYRDTITSIEIDDRVTSIGKHAFYYCENLTDITFSDNVITINSYAFANCDSLTEIIIPDNVTSIGSSAFQSCDNLKSINIGSGLSELGTSAFAGNNTRLDTISVSEENENYKTVNNVLFSKDETTLYVYPDGLKGTTYSIPDGVKSLAYDAFGYCQNLIEITIPDSMTSIGAYAFFKCTSLSNMTIPDSVTKIGSYAFFGCSALTEILLSNNIKKINISTFYGCTNLTSIVIPGNVTSIDTYSFYSCSNMTMVSIPDSVTEIDSNAFNNCSSLTDVYYSGSETEWASIEIGSDNSCLTDAAIHYNSTITTDISGLSVSISSTDFIYDGTPKEPTVSITDGSATLVQETDYTVAYTNNIKAGTATVTVNGTGNYDGTVTKDFTINTRNLSTCTISLSATSYTYNGSERKPSVTVSTGSIALTKGTDYTVAYSNNVNAGTAIVTITGIGSCTGTVTKNFTITSSESSSTNTGTDTSSSTSTGTTANSTKKLSSCTVTLSSTKYTYNGAAKKPTVTVKNGSTKLTNGTHYTVFYSNNVNAGTATVTVKGKGNYTGTVKKTFTISKGKNTITASDITKSCSKKKQSFSIKATCSGNAKLSYSSNNTKISVNSKGKITVKKNYIGTATIKIIASATKNYKKATKKITVTVSPAKTSITKLTAGTGSISIKWKKVSSCDGYEIYISSTDDFKKSTYSKQLKKNKINITGMASGKTYSVKVRTFKKVGKKTYYSAWSNVQYTQTK